MAARELAEVPATLMMMADERDQGPARTPEQLRLDLAEACRLLRALNRSFQSQSGGERDLQRTVEVFLTVQPPPR
jgi:hypothetical protein